MRERYPSSAELAWKIDSEGGVCEMLFGYGLHLEELPDDMPDNIRMGIRTLLAMHSTVEEVENYFSEAAANYREY